MPGDRFAESASVVPAAEQEDDATARDATGGETHPTAVVARAAARVALAESTRVGRYLVLRHIGAGAMGDVYLAYDETLDRRVAIKLLRPGGALDWSIRREAHALARLSHPNVVQIHDIGTHEGQPFIAMEFVSGLPLNKWLSAENRTVEAILRMFVQCGRGLEAAHVAGLVHRDFKPSNVMVGDDGRPRVLDFGVVYGPAVEVTASGNYGIVGTPAYMSPEQLLADPVGPASDQFSFAIAVFRSVYGEFPFAGADGAERLHNALENNVRIPSESNVPHWLAPVLRRALSREPAARYPSLAALLEAIEERLPRDAAFDPRPTRQGRRLLTALVIAAIGTYVVIRGLEGGLASATASDSVLVSSVVLGLAAVSLITLRRRIFANRFGVRIITVFMIVSASALVFPLLAVHFDQPFAQFITYDLFIAGFEYALVAVLFVRWFAHLAAAMFVAGAVALLVPHWATLALVIGRLGALLIAYWQMSKD